MPTSTAAIIGPIVRFAPVRGLVLGGSLSRRWPWDPTEEMTELRNAATLAVVRAIGVRFVVMPLVNSVQGGTASEEG